MRTRRVTSLALLLAVAGSVMAATNFPALTGRVVDSAQVLSPRMVQTLQAELSAQEQASSNQIVLVTVPDLAGETIEDYGYQLGRHWGIGQKGKDNGVLLIFAMKEHRLRIEVGYGLEGTLTDAVTSHIIQRDIVPMMKRGDVDGAALAGIRAIEHVLNPAAEGLTTPPPSPETAQPASSSDVIGFYFIIALFIMMAARIVIGIPLLIVLSIAGMFMKAAGNPRLSNYLESGRRNRFMRYLLGAGALGVSFGNGASFGSSDSSSSSSSSSDSNSGGGGGGSFGGGGSSGSW